MYGSRTSSRSSIDSGRSQRSIDRGNHAQMSWLAEIRHADRLSSISFGRQRHKQQSARKCGAATGGSTEGKPDDNDEVYALRASRLRFARKGTVRLREMAQTW